MSFTLTNGQPNPIAHPGKQGWWANLSPAEKKQFVEENPDVQYATRDSTGKVVRAGDPLADPEFVVPMSGMAPETMAKWDPVGTAELQAQQNRFQVWLSQNPTLADGKGSFSAWQLFHSSERVWGQGSTTDPFTPPSGENVETGGFNPSLSNPNDQGGVYNQNPSNQVAEGLVAKIAADFPWASEFGFLDMIKDLAIENATAEQIVAELRASEVYKQQFPGMAGSGGIRRFDNEGQYISARRNLRNVLIDYGAYDPATDSPMDYVAFFDAGIESNELASRFDYYRALEEGSRDLRDAFFVYAGMEVSVDDLFQATVSPQFRNELVNNYDQNVASQPLDYATYIDRARQVSTNAVVETLERMQARGDMTGTAVSRVLQLDPEFGQQLMASIFTGGGSAADTRTMQLPELTRAFEYAVMGSAATQAGFAIPDKARLEEFRQAGIDSAKLTTAYSRLGEKGSALSGMLNRVNRGADFGRELLDQELLGKGKEIHYAQQAERALGQRAGGFQMGQEGTRFTQTGRSLSY